jgi:hypothetical protein
MDCVNCKQQPETNFRKYDSGSYRSQCKKCENEYDKLRKKKKRQKHVETTYVECSRCSEKKALKEFAKLKKYDKKVCLLCYPLYLTECKTEWCAKERRVNPNYRLKKSLAARLRNVLHKNDTTMSYIGCNIHFLRQWLEYNFTADMTWENYGTFWSIDHVIPVSKFDLTIERQKLECWNWSNLVPVLCSYNSSKKGNLDEDQINNIKERIIKFKEEGSTTKWFSEDLCILLRYSLTLTEK